MSGTWRLRHLFTYRTHQEETEEAVVTTGTIDIDDLRIDTAHRSATLTGEDLALTPEEFEVVIFLTTHPQRFVTPRTMLATSWTRGGLHQTRFLKALLGLIKKIDAVSGKQYLRTEPWVVYRFDPNSSLATQVIANHHPSNLWSSDAALRTFYELFRQVLRFYLLNESHSFERRKRVERHGALEN